MTDGSVILKTDATPETLALFSQQGGPPVPFDPPQPTLTDAERDAVEFMLRHAAHAADIPSHFDSGDYILHHDALVGLLERNGGRR